ncbi:hypothetical protein PtA15_4A253 [Puccinia triticina]|uniref:Uncharacterized protein n=1 Tax=Puccinia triticina TaxID=208348 RepID=A0ABY7CF15_9BASI|nr:uncharacterized protein PtA15_4A253 [Puccinia triticina]WAQ83804.1 hypothetical protein PtA15_4A253 [Puccinia triticina]
MCHTPHGQRDYQAAGPEPEAEGAAVNLRLNGELAAILEPLMHRYPHQLIHTGQWLTRRHLPLALPRDMLSFSLR